MYMSIVFAMLIYYDVKKAEHGWLIPFELPNILYLLQVMYAWTTFVSLSETRIDCHYRISNMLPQHTLQS